MSEAQGVRCVSVVIPVRNETGSIAALLESLAHQTFAPSEIIVVDGGSTDDTAQRVRAMAETDERLRLIEAGPATPGRGRNVGLAAARYEWVALTDAGVWVETTWLEELVKAAEQHPDVSVVYGNYEPIVDTFFARCAALAYVAPKRRTAAGLVRGPSAISMLLRRETWERAGGFPDLRAGEDLIFMQRIADCRTRIAWAPAATAWWQLQPSLASTFHRFADYSRHNVRGGLQRHWHHGVARQYMLAAGFIALAIIHDSRWALALPAGLVLRTARNLWRRRGSSSAAWWQVNPAQFLGVMGILLALDVATFTGWVRAEIDDVFGRSPTA